MAAKLFAAAAVASPPLSGSCSPFKDENFSYPISRASGHPAHSRAVASPMLLIVSVLIEGLSHGARDALSYTRRRMQNYFTFRDGPIIP